MSQRMEGALAIVSAYVAIALVTLVELDGGNGSVLLRVLAPVVMLQAVRSFKARRDPAGPAVRAAGRTIVPLLIVGVVLVLAIAALGPTSGSSEAAAAVIGGLAAVAWWATPAVMAVRWIRQPW